MLNKIISAVGIISAGILLYILQETTPTEAGAMGVLAVFLLSYITLTIVLTYFIFWLYRLVDKVFYSDKQQSSIDRFDLRKSYYFSSVLALGPVMMVSLSSVGRGGLMEYGLVGLLLFLGCIYVSKRAM